MIELTLKSIWAIACVASIRWIQYPLWYLFPSVRKEYKTLAAVLRIEREGRAFSQHIMNHGYFACMPIIVFHDSTLKFFLWLAVVIILPLAIEWNDKRIGKNGGKWHIPNVIERLAGGLLTGPFLF